MKLVDALEYATITLTVVGAIRKVLNMKQLFVLPVGPSVKVEGDLLDDGRVQFRAFWLSKSGVEVAFSVTGAPKAALEELKAAIPGDTDDKIINLLEPLVDMALAAAPAAK